jgi:hypothetical protein
MFALPANMNCENTVRKASGTYYFTTVSFRVIPPEGESSLHR